MTSLLLCRVGMRSGRKTSPEPPPAVSSRARWSGGRPSTCRRPNVVVIDAAVFADPFVPALSPSSMLTDSRISTSPMFRGMSRFPAQGCSCRAGLGCGSWFPYGGCTTQQWWLVAARRHGGQLPFLATLMGGA
uniref:(northern house mosquito) hypothetical protein n=1 Tax=Culex pipiens TaxID=7175 RepID=A0A8D8H0C9_CULPI